MSDSLSARAELKRIRILEAALDLFLQQGPQGTTMEAIARRAGITKPTLYVYFPDKPAVLKTLVEDQISSRTEVFLADLEQEGDTSQLVVAALAKLFGTMAEVVEGSPFAAELLGESKRSSAVASQSNEAIVAALSTALARIGVDRNRELAAVLLAAGTGILAKYVGGRSVRDAMTLLCSTLLGQPDFASKPASDV